jgi:hypothetical protein
MTFQRAINITQAPGVEGDFASENPRFSVPSQVDDTNVNGVGWRAGNDTLTHGVFIARFAWADVATNTLVLNTGTGKPTGFIHRAMEGLNLQYFTTPSSTSFFIPAGFGVGELFAGGDFWVRHHGTGACAVGMKAFAKNAHTSSVSPDGGTIQFALAGTVIAGWTETKWIAGQKCLAGELTKMTSQPLG